MAFGVFREESDLHDEPMCASCGACMDPWEVVRVEEAGVERTMCYVCAKHDWYDTEDDNGGPCPF